jgi:hypothetical protein
MAGFDSPKAGSFSLTRERGFAKQFEKYKITLLSKINQNWLFGKDKRLILHNAFWY